MNLNSLKQTPTPLNSLYFSEFNMHLVQKGIRQKFRNDTNIRIDYQNPNDLYALMRVVFINNSGDHFSNVNEQVRAMNTIVIDTAVGQVKTGVAQYLAYLNDLDTTAIPIDRPENTSLYGKKKNYANVIKTSS